MSTNNHSQDHTIRLEITVRHSHSDTTAIREYASDAVLSLRKYVDDITSCHVVLDHQKNDKPENKIAEITVHALGKDFHSKSASQTYQKSIDECVSTLARLLTERKRMLKGI